MNKMMLMALASGALVNVAAMAASPDHSTKDLALFDNLATLDPKGVYTVGSGSGFGNVTENSPPVELAVAFTASTTTSVTEIDVGAGYISGTKNLVEVHLYQDAGGVPGTEIWSHATGLPVDGTCCAIAALKVRSLVKLTAGVQYWVSLGVAKGAADTFGSWYGNVADQVDAGLVAINEGTGWNASPAVPLPAFGVFGK